MLTSFTINGNRYSVDLSTLPAEITLNTFLREYAQLTATKFMCLEGGCGVCVCVVKFKDIETGEVCTLAVNSCLTFLNVCKDWEIITSEGIGNKREGYHPIQKRLAKLNGSQCGFCSPGFVMNMYALMESRGSSLTMEEIEDSFAGNICRCTGYRPILDAMKSFSRVTNQKSAAVDSTTALSTEIDDIEDLSLKNCPKSALNCKGRCFNPLQSYVFGDGAQWYWPLDFNELLTILAQINDVDLYMLVAGNTAHGVYRRPRGIQHFIDINNIPEVKRHSFDGKILTLGANLTLSRTMEIFKATANSPGFEYCEQLRIHFNMIAHIPVRNLGTLAGNIVLKKMHPDFVSDVFVLFEAIDVQVVLTSTRNEQKKMSLQDFMNNTTKKLVLTAFELKAYPKDKFLFESYKITPRAQNTYAIVNAAFLLELETEKILSTKVKSARMCYGGIRPNFVRATAVEERLIGKVLLAKETIASLFNEISTTFMPNDIVPEPSPEYRTLLACALLYKFLLSIVPEGKVKPQYKSGSETLRRPLSSGIQKFETIEKNYPITQPVNKIEGLIQCSGEAKYMDDVITASFSGYCVFVVATKVGAMIERIEYTEALQIPGVLGFYSAVDIPGLNVSYSKEFDVEDEEIFCSGYVKYFNQPLGVIVATTNDIAKYAATKVKVMYSNTMHKVHASLEDVLDSKEMCNIRLIIPSPLKSVTLSDKPAYIGSGNIKMGSQYHFTMEPQTTIVVPSEGGLKLYCATQWMDHTQAVIANMLQMKVNKVQFVTTRLGGGYGGKISRGNQVACAAALAAFKLNIPIRFVQSIESMMNSNGKRWACLSNYEFQVAPNGKILGLKNTFYQDAGCSLNENPIDAHSIEASRSVYDLTDKNYKVDGFAVLTDAPAHTWCRGPGTLEATAMTENTMEHIAFEANIDPADVRLANIKPGSKMAEILPIFLKSTEYRERQNEINAFNKKNRWRKRGLGLSVMQFALYYRSQLAATVAIYHADGTVIISHGGIEMGQGLNTKVAQVAAFVLGIPLDLIEIAPSTTINGANSFATVGSFASESVCFAVKKACTTLNNRLKPVRNSLKKDATWKEVIRTAFDRAVNLIANDQFAIGDLKNYSVYGTSVTEVEVDILTGNVLVKRVDIFEDTGESLSPYIDIGQVEGAFVMGLGYWLTEKLVFDRRTGELITNRTWNYKPPVAKDIPIDFRIELSQKYPNEAGFMRSKATGEPATCLAVSVMFAIRQALQSARNDAGLEKKWLELGAPTTVETIGLYAGTDVKSFALE